MNRLTREAFAAWRAADEALSGLTRASDDYWSIRTVRDEMATLCVELETTSSKRRDRLRGAQTAIRTAREKVENIRCHSTAEDAQARDSAQLMLRSARDGARTLLDAQPLGSRDFDELRTALITLDQLDSILLDRSAAPDVVEECRTVVNDTLVLIAQLQSDGRPSAVHVTPGADRDTLGVRRILWD